MRLALAAVVLLGVVACSDASGPGIRGTISFAYTGGGGGSFNASGDARTLGAPLPTSTSWVLGFVEEGETFIGASSPRSGGLVDMVILRIKRTGIGSESIDPTCDTDGGVSCTGMVLYLNFNGNGDSADFYCSLTSGAIVLTEVTSSRAKGTFSGNGSCIAGSGGAPAAFAVSGGAFDVALVPAPGGG